VLTATRIFAIGFLLGLCLFFNLIVPRKTMAGEPILRLYFLPFSIETYLPVTAANIEEHGHAIWFMEEHPFISKLRSMLQAHPAKSEILSKGIRLKADFRIPKAVFLVDRNGTVQRKDSGATFRLEQREVDQLEQEIRYFFGIVDVKAFERSKGVNP